MGDHKREFCKRGLHRMDGPNIMLNGSTGLRMCRRCRYDYNNAKAKSRRAAKREAMRKQKTLT